jgi:hypothetical protein
MQINSSEVIFPDECIIPFGYSHPSGYKNFKNKKRDISCHRASYFLFKGNIPSHLVVDHICRNRACINPKHLRLISLKENVLCGEGITAVNKRKTHCHRGHELTKENIYIPPKRKNTRSCIECQKIRNRKYYYKKEKICKKS